MKTAPITAARIEFGEGPDFVPQSPDYGDPYHPRVGPAAQAQHVFLQGNGLPARWAGRSRLVILEIGFGLGNNFLATWRAWRADPARCQRLCFVAIERHPPLRADFAKAHAASPWPDLAQALLQTWPPLTPDVHALDFDNGRVQLLLAFGDVAAVLPGLRVQADAFYLDGFAPARNPAMWQPRVLAALGRKAAAGATLATWSVARELRAGLTAAGFAPQPAPGIGGRREITVAPWLPRFTPRALPSAAVTALDAVVVGAGIAGAAVAQALARQGLAVTVFDQHFEPAAEASGNAAGLFHGTVIADDGKYARLYRAAALQAQRAYGLAVEEHGVAGSARGLLRIDLRPGGLAAMAALLQAQNLPPDYVQALSAEAASSLVGVQVNAPAWHYPGGGWIAPAAWVRHALNTPGVRFAGGVRVDRLLRDGASWVLVDSTGQQVASTPLLVLANAASAAHLLAPWGAASWPLSHTRGQVTQWQGDAPSGLTMPLAGEGYAIPLPSGGLLCGATRDAGEPGEHGALRESDHRLNIDRLRALTGLAAPADPSQWQGRVGWRLHADDRLPIAGALPLQAMALNARQDQARLLPRESGLFVITALGARGLTLAPLLARLVAAQATGGPWPLAQDLADAIDPARWLVRAARRKDQAG